MSIKSYSPSFRELITALTFSLLASAGAISLATLIYSGPILSKYIIFGISGGLFGSIIFRVINLLFSSYKITISSTQELFALFGSIIAASICRELHSFETEDILSTLITAMIIMNCTAGLFMLMLGKLRISEFIRYIPYPVNSGFLAGTGLLIISFSLMAITHISFSLKTIDLFFHPDTLWKWLIPFLYSILTIYLMRRLTRYRYLILPFMIFFAFIGFYLYLFFKGISWAQASSLGWTVGNFPNQSLVYPPSIKIISSKIHWDIIIRHIPNFLSLSFLVAINCFLNTSSFELISQKNLNINDEFKITGLSNILIGLFGGIGGYQNIAYSKIGLSFGTVTKSVNVLVIIILGLVLFLGVSILDVIPKCVVNFVLIYFGIDLTYTYIIEIKSKISWHYYLIVLAIAFNIVYFNIFIGIIVGLMMSMLLFVIQYSKIRVMTTILNSSFITSNVERSPYEMQILEQNYNKILIPIFSGYLFFGNSEKLVQKIKHKIENSDVEIGYAILDFSRTSGMEVSCYQSLLKLLQYCNKKNIEIIFCKLPQSLKTEMTTFIADYFNTFSFKEFSDLDHGLEWCEEKILQDAGFQEQNNFEFFSAEEQQQLLSYFSLEHFKVGDIVLKQNTPSHALYWLAEGTLEVWLNDETSYKTRLATIKKGNIIGEMGFFNKALRTASVIAFDNCILYSITEKDLNRLYLERTALWLKFNQYIITTMGHRLSNTHHFIQYLKSELIEPQNKTQD